MTPRKFQRFMAGDTVKKLNIYSPSRPLSEMDKVSANGRPSCLVCSWALRPSGLAPHPARELPVPTWPHLLGDPVCFHSVPGDHVGFLISASEFPAFSQTGHFPGPAGPPLASSQPAVPAAGWPVPPVQREPHVRVSVPEESRRSRLFSVACLGEGRAASGVLDSRN